jgi:hypothetical protein
MEVFDDIQSYSGTKNYARGIGVLLAMYAGGFCLPYLTWCMAAPGDGGGRHVFEKTLWGIHMLGIGFVRKVSKGTCTSTRSSQEGNNCSCIFALPAPLG